MLSHFFKIFKKSVLLFLSFFGCFLQIAMGKFIVENLTSPSHPTLKYDEIENKNINLSSIKIEVEEEEQKEMDLSFYDGSPDWIRSTPTMIIGADSDSIDYKFSSDSSGYSYSDGDEWSPLKGEPSSLIGPIFSTDPENFKKIVEKETKPIEYKTFKITLIMTDFVYCASSVIL
uniref:Uncharacterized protein n=1 Tax=Solanum lycopersicum TaxID=4081 RepID=K4B4A9_SOLLC